ncbi:hypothetical protein CCACVL1_20226 [Corchorus capsularis]|uniref:Uncharacterized protein n=1 Tax=Corchorus capsularis TaxID=210143 RepID=A0A1R3HCB0_COCAP|nr:hypothetical protein CCACVL1_20226 [Corchorus capsularis]
MGKCAGYAVARPLLVSVVPRIPPYNWHLFFNNQL